MPRLCVAVISCVLRVSSGSAHTWVPWFNDTERRVHVWRMRCPQRTESGAVLLEGISPRQSLTVTGPTKKIASRIMVILIRERLGVHTNVIFPADAEYLIFYAGVAGCNDWE